MQAEVKTINAKDASEIIGRSKTHNRTISRLKIEKIKSDIIEGRWVMNGEPIIFDDSGNLLDGHHRLVAVSETDRFISSVVISGIKSDAMQTIDIGRSRSLGDQFEIIKGKSMMCARMLNHMRAATLGTLDVRTAWKSFEDAWAFYLKHEIGIEWCFREGYGLENVAGQAKTSPRRFVKETSETPFLWSCLGLIHERSPSLARNIVNDLEMHRDGQATETTSAIMKVLLHNAINPAKKMGFKWHWTRIVIGLNHHIHGTQTSRVLFRGGKIPHLELDAIDPEQP